jgi:hypothetical protein
MTGLHKELKYLANLKGAYIYTVEATIIQT